MDHATFQRGPDSDLRLKFSQLDRRSRLTAVSGDGSRLLTVAGVDMAHVWDLATGEKVSEFRPTSSLDGRVGIVSATEEFRTFIESSDLNVDGTRALLGLNDRTAVVFDVASGREVARLRSHGTEVAEAWGFVRAVAFSPDGMLALVGFYRRQVGVWSGDGSRLGALLQAAEPDRLVGSGYRHGPVVSRVAVSHDNAYVFAGCMDMTAFVWQLATKTVVFEAMEHEGIASASSREGPERLPPRDMGIHAYHGAGLWKTPFGAFVHQVHDGPIGWPTQIRVDAGFAAIQTVDGVAVFRVAPGPVALVALLHVEGEVLVARVANGGRSVVAVTRAGAVVRWSLDASDVHDGG
jgi:WD40 repeat protein